MQDFYRGSLVQHSTDVITIMGNIELEKTTSRQRFTQNKYNLQAASFSQRHDTLKQPRQLRPLTDNLDTRRSRTPTSRKTNANNCKVGDFNEFLNQIKRHMDSPRSKNHRHAQYELQQSGSINSAEKTTDEESSHELVLKFRLQNERLQLEKYRRLVQRQLSKNHSIEKITLQGNHNQKRLTIHYEDLPTKKGVIAHKTPSKAQPQSFMNQIQQQKSKYQSIYLKAKKRHREMTARMEVLEQLIALYEKKQTQKGILPIENYSEQILRQKSQISKGKELKSNPKEEVRGDNALQCSTERVNRISDLFQNLNQIQTRQVAIERQIKNALELHRFDSESDSSGVLCAEMHLNDMK